MKWSKALFILAAVEILSFRLFPVGFYSDDWHFLWVCRNGFLEAVRFFASNDYWSRPIQIIQIPALYWFVGDSIFRGQAVLSCLCILEGFLAYRLFSKFVDDKTALCAAALSVAYPIRVATHLWVSNTSQLLAHCLMLGSLLLADRRLSSSVLFLLSVLTYESAAFLPLVLFFVPGESPTTLLKKHWHYPALYAIAFLWQFLAVSNPKSIELSSAHIVDVYFMGLNAILVAPVELARWVILR